MQYPHIVYPLLLHSKRKQEINLILITYYLFYRITLENITK